MDKFTYVGNADVAAIENLYQQYLSDPSSVDSSFKDFFEGFDFAKANFDSEVPENVAKEFKVLELIQAYRKRGHLFTKTNPVRERRKYEPTLDLENFGLSENDLETVFQAGIQIGIGAKKLREIVDHLQRTHWG